MAPGQVYCDPVLRKVTQGFTMMSTYRRVSACLTPRCKAANPAPFPYVLHAGRYVPHAGPAQRVVKPLAAWEDEGGSLAEPQAASDPLLKA